MVYSPVPAQSNFAEDDQIWESLKRAIADSSGFRGWQQEKGLDKISEQTNLEEQVRRYLRETLETLAY